MGRERTPGIEPPWGGYGVYWLVLLDPRKTSSQHLLGLQPCYPVLPNSSLCRIFYDQTVTNRVRATRSRPPRIGPTSVSFDVPTADAADPPDTTADGPELAGWRPAEAGTSAPVPDVQWRCERCSKQRSRHPHGISLLPRDLTADELTSAPVLASIDTLLIDDLSDEEDDAFAAAVGP
jgi:hypothetical protein